MSRSSYAAASFSRPINSDRLRAELKISNTVAGEGCCGWCAQPINDWRLDMPASRYRYSRWRYWLIVTWLVLALGPVLPLLLVVVVLKTWPLALLVVVVLLAMWLWRVVWVRWRR